MLTNSSVFEGGTGKWVKYTQPISFLAVKFEGRNNIYPSLEIAWSGNIYTKPFCWAQNPQLFHYLPYSNVFTSPGLLFTSPRVSIGQRISVGAWATFTYVYWSTSEAVFYLMNMEKPLKYLKCWKMLQVFAKQSVLGTPLHTSDMPLRFLTNPNPAHSSIVTGLAAI